MKEKVRWDSVLKTDPETQEQYWTRELVTVYKAEESDRINAVLDILKGVTTAEEVRKKYDITSINIGTASDTEYCRFTRFAILVKKLPTDAKVVIWQGLTQLGWYPE